MFNRVSPTQLEPRLDADFYKKEFIENNLKLKKAGSLFLSELISTKGSGYGVLPGSSEYVDVGGVPLIRGGDLSSGQIIVPEVQAPIYYKGGRATAYVGDILILIKGACIDGAEGVARVSEEQVGYLFNGSCYRLAFHDREVNGYFFLAFSQTEHFLKQKKRQVANTGISYNDESSIRHYLVPQADLLAKKYIGDKVRQAGWLRNCAKQLKAQVNKEIDGLSLPHDKKPEMISSVGSRILVDRLDPRPYRTHCLELISAIKKISNSLLADSIAMSSGCPVSSGDFIEDYDVPLVRIRNIGFDEFIGLDIGVSNTVYQGNIKYSAKSGCIVLGMDGNFRAQFFLDEELPMLINQRVAIFEPKDIRAELLTHWLNRPEGQIQLYQWAVKTTVDHTSLLDLRKMYIPRFNSKKEEELANMLKSARLAIYYSRKLTMSAKLITEALIDGKLTEQQLIDAQKALVSDNNSLDRDILSRLSTKGLDGDGDPLFPNLDQLYDLLAQSQQTDEQ